MNSPPAAEPAMVVIFAVVRAAPGRADELADELAATALTRSAEPGNIAFIVARSHHDPDEFRLCEIYADAAAHAEHRRLARSPGDPHSARLAQLLAEPPSVVTGDLLHAGTWLESGSIELTEPVPARP